MTDQSLRDTLEPLIAAAEAHGARFDFQLARFRTMLAEQEADLPLAAHPAEPADMDRILDAHFGRQPVPASVEVEITDEAVKAGANAYWETEGNRAVCMRAALEAALPHLTPQPSRTAEAVGYNIVNQLADLWEVPVDVRQATNDRCWTFAAKLVATAMNGKSDG